MKTARNLKRSTACRKNGGVRRVMTRLAWPPVRVAMLSIVLVGAASCQSPQESVKPKQDGGAKTTHADDKGALDASRKPATDDADDSAGRAGAGGPEDSGSAGDGALQGGGEAQSTGVEAGTYDAGVISEEQGCLASCDDGLSCTVDSCRRGDCLHTIGPVDGATACPVGQYCTVEDGCVAAPACATDEDCEMAWAADPCKTEPRCDPASSVCLFDYLDKDSDGHAPQVCGGADCNDDELFVNPDMSEACNLVDDDCDGAVDETEGVDSPCTRFAECIEGKCECDAEYKCGGACVDFDSDDANCGACGAKCNQGTCVNGACECLQNDGAYPHTACPRPDGSYYCTYLPYSPSDCGACGNQCGPRESCTENGCEQVCPYPGPNGGQLHCTPDEICIYIQGGAGRCVPDPCQGELLSCEGCGRNACPEPDKGCAQQGPAAVSCN